MEKEYLTRDEAIEVSNWRIKENSVKFAKKVLEEQKININKKDYVWI